MAITTKVNAGSQEASLIVTERLTFDQHRAFTEAYKSISGDYSRYVLDIKQIDYMDSAALGMLLKMKEHLGLPDRKLTILTQQGMAADVLKLSKFDMLFDLKIA